MIFTTQVHNFCIQTVHLAWEILFEQLFNKRYFTGVNECPNHVKGIGRSNFRSHLLVQANLP